MVYPNSRKLNLIGAPLFRVDIQNSNPRRLRDLVLTSSHLASCVHLS